MTCITNVIQRGYFVVGTRSVRLDEESESILEEIGRRTGTSASQALKQGLHILGPSSRGSDNLREFVLAAGMAVWFFDPAGLERAFELMEIYHGHPVDLADASLIVAAEALRTRRKFTLDNRDFRPDRVRRARRHYAIDIVNRRRRADRSTTRRDPCMLRQHLSFQRSAP